MRWTGVGGLQGGLPLQGGAPAHAPLRPAASDERVGRGLVWVWLDGRREVLVLVRVGVRVRVVRVSVREYVGKSKQARARKKT